MIAIKINYSNNVSSINVKYDDSPVFIKTIIGDGSGGAAVWGGITGTLSNQTDLQTALNGKFDDPTGTTAQYIDGTGGLQTFPLTLPVLQEVRNQTGATLAAGTVVYISGATGNKPTVSKAIATGDNTSAQTLGMIQSAIANNSTGYVVVIGTCSGLDTSAYTEGQQLYLSYTTAGAVTTTKPYAPNHLVYVGIVTRSHPTLGTIEVRVQNGYEMDELHNVDALNPTNNDGLFYNTTTSLWEHKSIGTVLGYNPEQPLTFSSPLSRLVNAVSIPAATSSVNGYLSSTDWSTFNGKENALTFSSPLSRSTNTISIPQATSSVSGFLSSTDWSTFNSKQGALTLTTTGTSGAATLVGNTLNIPQYSGGAGMAIGGSITSATAGSVLFAGTSGVLAQDNSNLFWDDTNDRLGIRTSSPNAALHVSGSTTASGAIARGANYTPTLVAAANNDVLVGLDVNPTFTNGAFSGVSNIGIRINNAPLLITPSTSSTSVGIGSANVAICVGPSSTGNSVFRYIRTANTNYSTFEFCNGSVASTTALWALGLRETTDNHFHFYHHAISDDAMRIFATTGNVGIRQNTDAGFRLDVNGTARMQSNLTLSAMTAGSVHFTGTGGLVSEDASNLFWDNTNKRLGIGTNAPTRSLYILSSSATLQELAWFKQSALSAAIVLEANTGQLSYIGQRNTSNGGNGYFTSSGGFSVDVYGSSTPIAKFLNNGNVQIGSSTDAGFKLDVNGTVRLQSTLDILGSFSITKNQNLGTFASITNTTSGTASEVYFSLVSDGSSGSSSFGKNSTTKTANKFVNAKDAYFYNSGGGDIAFLNDFASGNIKFGAGGSSTAQLTLVSNGNLLLGTTTDSGFRLDVNGTARVQSKLSLSAGTISNAQINLASSTAPTSPANGDIWFDGTDLKMRIGGVTKTFTLI